MYPSQQKKLIMRKWKTNLIIITVCLSVGSIGRLLSHRWINLLSKSNRIELYHLGIPIFPGASPIQKEKTQNPLVIIYTYSTDETMPASIRKFYLFEAQKMGWRLYKETYQYLRFINTSNHQSLTISATVAEPCLLNGWSDTHVDIIIAETHHSP